MHYYQHNIGDYLRDTAHLSVIEHGVYRLLLDWCYLNELPITTDKALRLGRGYPVETQSVLSEFFVLKDGAWEHGRVAKEVSQYHQKAEKNRLNGVKGGRPKPNNNPVGSQSDAKPNPNQEPSTKNQEPREIQEPTVLVKTEPVGPISDPPAQVVKLADRRMPCPAERLLEAFHTECPTLPRVMKLNDKRRQHLTARWREVDADSKFTDSEDGIEVFRSIFRKVSDSDFLSGRAKAWHATFDWLTDSSTNFLKVCEGHYDNDRRATK